GENLGRKVGQYVADHYFQPLTGSGGESLAAAAPAPMSETLHAGQVQQLMIADLSNVSVASLGVVGGTQDSALATGQPRMLQSAQPTWVLATNSVDNDQAIQRAEIWDRLTARALNLRALDQALAGLDNSMFAGPF